MNKEIYPKIMVYSDLLKDPDRLYKIMKKSEQDSDGKFYLRKWTDWSIFGTYTQQKHDPKEEFQSGDRYDEEKYLSDSVYEAYQKAIDHYIDYYDIKLPETAELASSSFSKYDYQSVVEDNDMAMQYHTDFVISEKDMPGQKFLLTCTTYINDDYEGGAVEFYINGEIVTFKPKAGDILVFPSGDPYYHGVTAISKAPKFFIRNFMMYEFDGTKEWLDNQKRYGAMRWFEMEKDRLFLENKGNQKYRFNGKVVSAEEFETLYGGNDGVK